MNDQPVMYRVDEKQPPKPDKRIKSQYLDPNHTHFFLVDNSQLNAFGGEIKFRVRFEKEIFKGAIESSAVPVVMVVIEGGPNTIKCVLESLEADIPVLVLDVGLLIHLYFLLYLFL